MSIQIYKQIYQRAGFSDEHAAQLADIVVFLIEVNEQRKLDGRPTLTELMSKY